MAKLKTGRHTGALKADRQAERRAARNRTVRRSIRSAAKELLEAVEKKDKTAVGKLYPQVASLWDKAAKTGLVHWKAAARKKSRLAQKVQSVIAA